MKKNIKRITLIALTLLLTLTFAACLDPSADGSDIKTIHVSMDVIYPKDADIENVTDFEMQVEESATVLDVLKSFADQQDIEVIIDDSSSSVYVTSINGYAAEDTSGWIYEVNNETVMEEASHYVLANGDEVTWEYKEF